MPDKYKKLKEKLVEILVKAGLWGLVALIVLYVITAQEHMDEFGGQSKSQKGRAKNVVAAMVTGLVAQNIYGSSKIDVNVEKQFWPDVRVTGQTSPESIRSEAGLTVSVASFTAGKNAMGFIEGEVRKSGFNWKVIQTGSDSYDIEVSGPKFNPTLELRAQGGKISGMFYRPGFQYEWYIDGTYDQDGNVEIEIDGRWTIGFTLKGRITPDRGNLQ